MWVRKDHSRQFLELCNWFCWFWILKKLKFLRYFKGCSASLRCFYSTFNFSIYCLLFLSFDEMKLLLYKFDCRMLNSSSHLFQFAFLLFINHPLLFFHIYWYLIIYIFELSLFLFLRNRFKSLKVISYNLCFLYFNIDWNKIMSYTIILNLYFFQYFQYFLLKFLNLKVSLFLMGYYLKSLGLLIIFR